MQMEFSMRVLNNCKYVVLIFLGSLSESEKSQNQLVDHHPGQVQARESANDL